MITGKINVPVKLVAAVAGDWRQLEGPELVNLKPALDRKSASFTPSKNGVYKFVGGGNQKFEVNVGGTVTPPPVPPTPTPAGNLIYNSRTNSTLHNGIVRTITEEGIIQPGALGVKVAASGSPKIRVNADGTFSLVSGSGTTQNFSIKVRSRHNEGGSEENRFGGVGTAIAKNECSMKIEKFHNEHESGVSKSLPKQIQTNQWVKVAFTCKDVTGGIYQLTEIDYNDGKGFVKVNESTFKNPPAYYQDKVKFTQNSYLWLRLNNSDHGRIYVFAKNYNSRIVVEFKFDSGNSITFKSVELFQIA